jgi:hypothetical protein
MKNARDLPKKGALCAQAAQTSILLAFSWADWPYPPAHLGGLKCLCRKELGGLGALGTLQTKITRILPEGMEGACAPMPGSRTCSPLVREDQ